MDMTEIRKQFANLMLQVNFAGYVNKCRVYRIVHIESGSEAVSGLFTKSGLIEYLDQ